MNVSNRSKASLIPCAKTTKMENKTLILLGLLVAVCCAAAGRFEDVDIDQEDVKQAANAAAKRVSENLSSKYHHRLHKIQTAQVAKDSNYKMTIIIGMTDCLKKEQSFDEIQDCEFQHDISTFKKCTVLIYRNQKNAYKLISSGCVLATWSDVKPLV